MTDGVFLFRWRSYLPLVLAPFGGVALYESVRIEQLFGERIDVACMLVGLTISLCGLAIRWLAVASVPAGTSGRNTRSQRADTLNTTGMYSIVRNPLYLGNFLALIRIVLATKVWWFVAMTALAYWLYIEPVIATEESYLSTKFGDTYAAWVAQTPIFLPRTSNWRAPELSFSVQSVLRREYNGVMTVATAFFLLEFIMDILIEREQLAKWLRNDFIWVALFAAAAVLSVALRHLKKRTTVLDAPGRR